MRLLKTCCCCFEGIDSRSFLRCCLSTAQRTTTFETTTTGQDSLLQRESKEQTKGCMFLYCMQRGQHFSNFYTIPHTVCVAASHHIDWLVGGWCKAEAKKGQETIHDFIKHHLVSYKGWRNKYPPWQERKLIIFHWIHKCRTSSTSGMTWSVPPPAPRARRNTFFR